MPRGKGKANGGKNEVELAERRRKAVEMRKAGCSYDEIAQALGFSNSGNAYHTVHKALKATYREPAEELRTLELERVDRLMRAIWPQAIKGDVDAIDRVLKIMSRRARLLGLDCSPTPLVPETSNVEHGSSIAELESRLIGLIGSGDQASEPISTPSRHNGDGSH